MIALLLGLIGKAVSWLASVLPSSPFANLMPSLDPSLSTAIAWLNTFVPVGQIGALVGAWALAMVAVVAVKTFKKFTIDRFTSVVDVS